MWIGPAPCCAVAASIRGGLGVSASASEAEKALHYAVRAAREKSADKLTNQLSKVPRRRRLMYEPEGLRPRGQRAAK